MHLDITTMLLIGFAVFAVTRSLTYLHIFQQEEYDGVRFLRWLAAKRAFDHKASAAVLAATAAAAFSGVSDLAIVTVLTLIFVAIAGFEADPLKTGKKKLALTQRAKRILYLELGLIALIAIFIASLAPLAYFLWLPAVHAIPLLLVAATLILSPFDKSVNAKFRAEAIEKLQSVSPFIIGVTGSYGKTSVKHILGHILQSAAPTLVTPGSVNTEMGITRIIREQLTPRHRYFVVEMGAYGIGSIGRLCAFTPPKLGIMTAIGHAHYERFKTLEDTARAKFELAQAAEHEGGKTIIAESAITATLYGRDYVRDNLDQFITVGPTASVKLAAVEQQTDGLAISLTHDGKTYAIHAPLYGKHHGMNVALAFAAALELGMDADDIITALRSTPQITHRLEVKKQGQTTLIDDAYNSNPEGFASALELLAQLKQNGRGILVTPGMVELGDAHEAEHARIGALAGKAADIVLAILPDRIPSFIKACKDNGGTVIEMPHFAAASSWMNENLVAGDVVLLENDLPDLFEKTIAL
jgi:UDP-N-acetylmuramoyl-tripeptide--D-alanyl-D-alanine ligase